MCQWDVSVGTPRRKGVVPVRFLVFVRVATPT